MQVACLFTSGTSLKINVGIFIYTYLQGVLIYLRTGAKREDDIAA